MSSGSIPVFRPSLTNSSQAGGISYWPLVLSMARRPTSSRNDEMPACRIIERFAFSRPLPWPKWVQAPTTNGSAAVPVAGNSAIHNNQLRMPYYPHHSSPGASRCRTQSSFSSTPRPGLSSTGERRNPRDPGGQFRSQQPVVGRLHRKLAHRRDPHVYGKSAEFARLQRNPQRNPPRTHSRLREAGPGFPAIPLEELVQAEVVNATRDRGRDAVEHQPLQPLPLGGLRNYTQISHLGPHNGHYR